MTAQLLLVGECMLELRAESADRLSHSAAGDTFNTAVYLKRLLPELPVRYVSALGDDQMSGIIRAHMGRHGVDDGLVCSLPGRTPGLYAIETDAAGERKFSYWRAQSAARGMLDEAHLARLYAALPDCRWLFLTGITLAILDDERRAALLALATRVRELGGWVIVDDNHRPALWKAEPARLWLDQALRICTHALLGFDDQAQLYGDADPQAMLARILRNKTSEVVIKAGSAGCLVGGHGIEPRAVAGRPVRAVDTTAAGDSFNAGYLAARLSGQPPPEAAAYGCGLAGIVVAHRGAIIPLESMPAPPAERVRREP
ncbi:sugar kinase [Pseudoduganella namucuonensis]|uniref:2-dehydro-3-deoxygluconokinase n=1 Tax=Pseudoduganella namucuonensis TaxID=1035707 RepID=A0A1I7L7M0_9BURK|nr:sugar kinase [Pseudoduganella namucuonensis]SFV05711.1 2-dehydro-3-deoxygluconokinase [Pseudoduganella namucuonensis]